MIFTVEQDLGYSILLNFPKSSTKKSPSYHSTISFYIIQIEISITEKVLQCKQKLLSNLINANIYVCNLTLMSAIPHFDLFHEFEIVNYLLFWV